MTCGDGFPCDAKTTESLLATRIIIREEIKIADIITVKYLMMI
ncbi:hypothetical protein [Nitrosopumilus sp.]|nr:hypothetical protein [Nitrosopumilus sp.]